MEITRHHHLDHMTKLTPLLILAVVVQSYLYHRFAPAEIALEVTYFLAGSLILLILGYNAHHTFHKVSLKPNYLEIKVSPLKYQEEILYTNIEEVTFDNSRKPYGNLTLTLNCGKKCRIFYVDDVKKICDQIEKRKFKLPNAA